MWFGDERGYNATAAACIWIALTLWFGDERGYNATVWQSNRRGTRCGLVMKEDITQQQQAGRLRNHVVVW